MIKPLGLLLIFGGLSLFAATCTTEQGAYSGGYQNGIMAKKNPNENKNMDYYVLKNGGCRGMINAYSSAKYIAPTQFKTSVDTVYLLCVQGAFAGYDGNRPGKYYKKECEDYPIAKLKNDKHIVKNYTSNEDERYSSEENEIDIKQKLLSQRELEQEEEKRITQAKAEQEAVEVQRIAQAKAEQEAVEAQRNAQAKAEEEYQKNLPQLKSELLAMRKKAKILNCQGHGQTTLVDSDIAYCKKVGLCYRRIDIRGDIYVFPFQLEKSLFGEYRAKIYKGKGVLLSQCRTKEESEGRFNIVFPQEIVNLPYPKINSATSEYSKTQQYKMASDKWELDHPLWGEYNLSPSDIEYAEQQIVNELDINEK